MNAAAIRSFVIDRLGIPGVAGTGLLLFSLAFWFGTLGPAHEELSRLKAERGRLAAGAAAAGGEVGPAAAPAVPLPMSQMPALLKKLNALAESHGLQVERSSYQVKGGEGPRRLEIELPLRTAYPALRAFLRDAVELTPTAALDTVTLQRTQATDPAVDAQVRLSFVLAAAP